MQPHNLNKIFNKFSGKEVEMTETPRIKKIFGETYTYNEVHLADAKDPTIEEMKKAAKDNGLSLRLWWEGVVGTMDFRTDRVNAHIEKAADGKWRVSNKFDIG